MKNQYSFLQAVMEKIKNEIINSDEDVQDLTAAIVLYDRIGEEIEAFAAAPEMTVLDLTRLVDRRLRLRRDEAA